MAEGSPVPLIGVGYVQAFLPLPWNIRGDYMEDEKNLNQEESKEVQTKPEETKEEAKAEEKKEPEKKPEEKKEENKASENLEVKVDVEKLKAELEEATQKASQVEALNTTVEQLNGEIKNKDAVIKEYEDLVGKMIETKLEQVPAEFKDLIPDNLDLKQKLNWLDKAESKGLFTREKKEKPNIEIGKPINVETPQIDVSKYTGGQLLKLAYNTIKR